MNTFLRYVGRFDFIALGAVALITLAGLVTMNSFGADNYFFAKQSISLIVSFAVMCVVAFFDARIFRRTSTVISLYTVIIGVLLLLFVVGVAFKGAQSWFTIGGFALQPSEFAKIALILTLSKYFARRHVEIAHIKHIFVSGLYALVLFVLVALQPDFGSAMIIFLIWFGMVLMSGISKKHLFFVFAIGAISFGFLWFYTFEPYQKDRILTFIHPLADIRGAGYNAFQSTVAVGSGELWGKGLGYGTQSRLQFLPEYETDFIFAAFAEEWGYVGVLILFGLFGILLWRLIRHSMNGATNFESFYCLGFAAFMLSHIVVHVGMNMGLLPVTGITMPFMSYGGSHLLAEAIGLGLVFSMSSYEGASHRDYHSREIVGVHENGLS